MALRFKKPGSLRLWTRIINKSYRKLQVARWNRMEIQTRFINQWPPSPCELGGWSLLSVISSLLGSCKLWQCLLVLGSISSWPARSPLLLLAIIQALFELQDPGVLTLSFFACSCLCPAVTEAAAFPKETCSFCHRLGDATRLSLLLKEWEQTNWWGWSKGKKQVCIPNTTHVRLSEWWWRFPSCDHTI